MAGTTQPAESRAERMSRRQAAFREDFRAKIGRLYHGWAHVALIYAIETALCADGAEPEEIAVELGNAP